ncbi:Peroxisomal biogenesis factor 3 [Zalerion maritima]|uniref:Peroxisomal biogenesis factor 3 n=1 Tax=Zalerion maritima TaxID=339359 RepID=A0AAD5RNG6_9PEZI|nr:Peroxisomal biogenesis factor 3 [Zalerion maritima]
MISATRRWFRRNRTPIAVGMGVVGAGYLATQYVIGKINDARERMSSDRIAKENLRRRFEQNQEDCTFTVLALLPTATTNIIEAMNTEQITYEIQQMKGSGKTSKNSTDSTATPPSIADTAMTEDDGKSAVGSMQSESGVHASQITVPPAGTPSGEGAQDGGQQLQPVPPKPRRTKRQLWDDLKISSITRAFTLIYTLSLLTLFTRIQLNLLGRRSYLSSVISLATGSNSGGISLENHDDNLSPEHAYGGDLDTNHKYLAFSWWLLNRGWVSLQARIESAVREVFGHLSPRETLTYEAFSQLALQVRKKVEGETTEERRKAAWLPFLLPPREMENEMLAESGILDSGKPSAIDSSNSSNPPQVRKLLDETSDLIESPVFHHVLTLLLDAGFAVLVENKLAQGVFELPPPENAAAEPLQATRAVLLPRILSVLTRQAHVVGSGSVPNEYLVAMEQVPDLNAFSAVVYSANWQSEIAAADASAMGTADEVLGASAAKSMKAEAVAAAASLNRSRGLGDMEESAVFVDAESDFESAWAKAAGGGS